MEYRFPYACYDLGKLQQGDTVVVRLHGPAANVMLLDPKNFARYRGGFRFSFVGGNQRRSPVRLPVPRDGHWFVAMDLGGRPGRVRGAVSVLAADGSRRDISKAEERSLTQSTA